MTGLKSTATWVMARRMGTPGPRPGCSMPMRTGAWRSSGCGCAAPPTNVPTWAVHPWRPRRSCSSQCATRSVPQLAEQIRGSGCAAASLEPYLDLIAVRVANERVRQAGTEFATGGNNASRTLDRCHGGVDVLRCGEAKSKMDDAAGGARNGGTLLKGQNVVYPGAQNLHGGVV